MIRGFRCKYDIERYCESDKCDKCKNNPMYQQGRADEHKNTEMFREIFLEDLINQSINREEAIMYRNICEMSWSKYLEQLKEQKNE